VEDLAIGRAVRALTRRIGGRRSRSRIVHLNSREGAARQHDCGHSGRAWLYPDDYCRRVSRHSAPVAI